MNTLTQSLLSNTMFLIGQTRRILFSGKFIYFIGFAILYEIFLIVIMNFTDAGAMPVDVAFYMMNMVPMLILAVYLSMMLVSYEKENNTIETMFSIPGSPYKVWLYKLLVMYTLMFFIQIILVLTIYFFVADFYFPAMLIHAYIPVILVSNLTFYFSTKFRSGYAAGLITLIICFIIFMIAEPLYENVWFLYLSPYAKPDELNIELWNTRLLYNKLGVSFTSILFMYLGLKRLLVREPFID
ncbi:MAG: hypothetical protein GY863_01365 [bacterium]|nr:hypothetical protein [bacterium]